MKIMYQVRYQLGGTGKMHRSFQSAVRDLAESRRSARKNGDQQAITLVKFDDLYSDFSHELPLTNIATQEMRCGSCGDTIAEGDEYYWHRTGTVECVPCYEANEAHKY